MHSSTQRYKLCRFKRQLHWQYLTFICVIVNHALTCLWVLLIFFVGYSWLRIPRRSSVEMWAFKWERPSHSFTGKTRHWKDFTENADKRFFFFTKVLPRRKSMQVCRFGSPGSLWGTKNQHNRTKPRKKKKTQKTKPMSPHETWNEKREKGR